MRRVILIFACLIGLVAGSLTGAAAVLASGTNTSAGDNQYVDPLAGTTHASSSPTSSPSSSSSSSGSSSSSSNSSLSTAPSTLASGSSSSTDPTGTGSSAHGGTLPFTGMNIWACVAIGAGLLGAGVLLRRGIRAT